MDNIQILYNFKYFLLTKKYLIKFINKIFIKNNDEGKILIYHHLKKKSIPFDGWFHNCFFCSTITGREYDYKFKNNNFKLIVCKDCKYEKF